MIVWNASDPWPKTYVRDPSGFGPEREVDKTFHDVFADGMYSGIKKTGHAPTHLVIGKVARVHLRTEARSALMFIGGDLEQQDHYGGLTLLFNPKSGIEFLWDFK